MFLVVINHLPIPSYFYLFTVDRIGVVTGAELFVMISGFVLGTTHRARIERHGWNISARSLLRRSFQIYLTIVAVTLAIWLVHHFSESVEVLMKWTDPATQQSYWAIPHSFFENSGRNTQDLLRMRLTPPQINILGFFVISSAFAPLALWLLSRKQTVLLLALSGMLYAANFSNHWRVTPAIFENPFPLLSWQMPFIAALVFGYYQREISNHLENAKLRLTLLSAAITVVLICIFFTWNNPWYNGFQYDKIPDWARLAVITPTIFDVIYARTFGDRTWLFAGRLMDAAAILFVSYVAVAKYWNKANRLMGWFFVPLGQASLFVFVMHLLLVVLLSLPAAQGHTMTVNTLLHATALLTLWAMVKTRFLRRLVPA